MKEEWANEEEESSRNKMRVLLKFGTEE